MRLPPVCGRLMPVPMAETAQTAEEAIACVLMATADGAKPERGRTVMSWKQTGSSPATDAGAGILNGRSNNISFVATATNPCNCVIRIAGPRAIVPAGIVALRRVKLKEVTDVPATADALPRIDPESRQGLFG